MSLEGRTALITGAGSGLGRALAIEASRRCMRIALVGRRSAKLDETHAQLVTGPGCLAIPGDITDPQFRRMVRDRIEAKWGRLDCLVNNAGIVAAGPLATSSDDATERLIATNVVAPIGLTRELLPLLRASPHARIINVGSIFGDIAFPLFGVYSASKFAMRGLSNAGGASSDRKASASPMWHRAACEPTQPRESPRLRTA
jgi:short-subunit dehydrogenase